MLIIGEQPSSSSSFCLVAFLFSTSRRRIPWEQMLELISFLGNYEPLFVCRLQCWELIISSLYKVFATTGKIWGGSFMLCWLWWQCWLHRSPPLLCFTNSLSHPPGNHSASIFPAVSLAYAAPALLEQQDDAPGLHPLALAVRTGVGNWFIWKT